MIEGLTIYEDWISKEQEEEIIALLPVTEAIAGNQRNSIHRYGSSKPYTNDVKNGEIPAYLRVLGEKLVVDGFLSKEPDSISLNEYLPGQKIDYHIDSTDSGEVISVLSLLGRATIKFSNNPMVITRELQPRSLLQMRGSARWEWKHALDPVLEKRWSIVFRNSTT